jgi:PST family polysaccharide transporter
VRWVAVARGAVEILVFGASLVLARLIPPAEFGHATIALVVGAFGPGLLGSLFGAAVVQRNEIGEGHLRAAGFLGLAGGAALTVVAAGPGTAGTAAIFDDRTADMVRLISPAFLLAGLAVAPQAQLQRQLDFRSTSLIELSSIVLGAGTTIALAVAGVDAEAIVAGSLAAAGSTVVGSYAAAPFVAPRPHRTEIRDLVRFGIPAGLGTLALLCYRNADYAVVGARLGSAQLGIYWRAFQLGAEYQGKISTIMLRIAFPLYSRTRDLAEMRRIRVRVVRLHASVIFPLLALLIAIAPELVPLLYGERWEPAVVPTQILAVGGMVAAVLSGIGPIMLAVGEPRRLAVQAWALATLLTAAALLAAPAGINAVCIAVVGTSLVGLVANHYLLLQRRLGVPLGSLLEEAGPALLASAVMLAGAYPAARGLTGAGVDAWAVCTVVGSAGLVAYAVVLRAVGRAAWDDVLLVLRRLMPRRIGRLAG